MKRLFSFRDHHENEMLVGGGRFVCLFGECERGEMDGMIRVKYIENEMRLEEKVFFYRKVATTYQMIKLLCGAPCGFNPLEDAISDFGNCHGY